jgi:hypothetical protein
MVDPFDECIRQSAGLGSSSPAALGAQERLLIDRTVLRGCLAARGDGNVLRRLLFDQAVWMRQYVASLTVGSPESDAQADRLVKLHADLGAAFAQMAGGGEAGQQMTALLNEHVAITTQRLLVASQGKQVEFEAMDLRWQQNASDIAALLATAQPGVSQEELNAVWMERLDLLNRVSIARLNNDWAADVQVFDALLDNASRLADLLKDSASAVQQTSSSSSRTSLFGSEPGSPSSSSSYRSSLFDRSSGEQSSSSNSSLRTDVFNEPSSSSSSRSTGTSSLFQGGSSSAGTGMY